MPDETNPPDATRPPTGSCAHPRTGDPVAAGSRVCMQGTQHVNPTWHVCKDGAWSDTGVECEIDPVDPSGVR